MASPPMWALLWAVLLLLLGAGGLAWLIEVPISVQGRGVVVEQEVAGQRGGEVVAVLFFSPDQLANLHQGQSATVSIGTDAITVTGSIQHVEATLTSPDEARSRYKLQGELAQVITGPSVMVTVFIGPVPSAQIYAGSTCNAQIKVGSQRVLSLLPGVTQIFGK